MFGEQGYSGPFTLCSPEEMAPIRERIEREVLATPSPYPVHRLKDRFLDSRVVYELCAHPAVVGVLTSIFGPDLLLFASSLFVKEPGFPPFPWHCDGPYWPMVPLVGATAWIALDEATIANGCVSILPGSHRVRVPHERFGYGPGNWLLRKVGVKKLDGLRAKRRHLDESRAVPMEVQPGQFFVFTEQTVHMAGGNSTKERRAGLAVRVTIPQVRIRHDEIFRGHHAILISGEDRFGWNRLTSPPE